jgi:glutamine synthetase
MIREELVFVASCDISGHVRGKGFPARELPGRLKKGIGWTGSNLMMSPKGPIWDTPFGTAGDFMIVPDPATEVRVDFADGSAAEHFFLGDICETDGRPWECCPRAFLRRAAAALEDAAGLHLVAAFEQEFVYTGTEDRPGDAYALAAFRRQGVFGEGFVAALRAAGVVPDSFLPEYGPRQFEVTVAPQPALTAADHAVITREMARAAAFRLGARAVFSPKPLPDAVGSGVHIHMSLWDGAGQPATYAPGEAMELSPAAQHFAAGILHHMPAICAVTAPSPVSYLRLVPNAWAPTAIDLVAQDRGACLRVAPVFAADTAAERARQFNLEFRASDAAASPYLAFGAILFAGADGIRRGLPLPATDAKPVELPSSLGEALDRFEASEAIDGWFGPVFRDAYLRFKRVEAQKVADLSAAELCAHYAEIY